MPAQSLQLEVTESLFIGDEEYSIATLHELADTGVSIAVNVLGPALRH